MEYTQTRLWTSTLAPQKNDKFENERSLLRSEFQKAHKNASYLANEIAISMPEFTVHDISHIDALWDMTDIFLSDDYSINPAEAFVLGCAFLFHDLGMGLSSYSDNGKDIENRSAWKDNYTKAILSGNSEESARKRATETALRLLHAEQARNLPRASWPSPQGSSMYIMENLELREAYGDVIGNIAYSHWLNVDELHEFFPTPFGSLPSFPSWTIDGLKLACILRIADAMQIDDRRAPYRLRPLRSLSEESSIHWNFQEKMLRPTLKNECLQYTSKCSFLENESKSWWKCYDTINMIDAELYAVDMLLRDTQQIRFAAKGVFGAKNPRLLSKFVPVQNWTPVDYNIKVSNVSRLVYSLGGKQLYGDNSDFVPLRELVQNASDAIRARKVLEEDANWYGDIIVEIGQDSKGHFLSVSDNGIGMSQNVLLNNLLDFGSSFWSSDAACTELPSLLSKGFQSTGQYGIGFFSVFMWSNNVEVRTKRLGAAREDTLVLTLDSGPNSRPLLKKADDTQQIRDGGTCVTVWFESYLILRLLLASDTTHAPNFTWEELLEYNFPTLDCNLYLCENKQKKKIIQGDDWITMDNELFLRRVLGKERFDYFGEKYKDHFDTLKTGFTFIYDSCNRIIGRAAVNVLSQFLYNEDSESFGFFCIGGIRTESISPLCGVLTGHSNGVSRNSATPIASFKSMQKWAETQQNWCALLANIELSFYAATILMAFDIVPIKLPIAYYDGSYLSYNEVVTLIKDSQAKEIYVTSYSEFRYSTLNDDYRSRKVVFPHFLFFTDAQHSMSMLFKKPDCFVQHFSKALFSAFCCACGIFETATREIFSTKESVEMQYVDIMESSVCSGEPKIKSRSLSCQVFRKPQ